MIPKEDIISMARRTGASIQWTAGVPPAPVALSMSWQQLERFAQLVAAHAAVVEREACWQAVRAEHLTDSQKTDGDIAYDLAIEHAAAAIRNRGS